MNNEHSQTSDDRMLHKIQ